MEEIKKLITTNEEKGLKIFPCCLTCTYSFKNKRYSVKGYHNSYPLNKDHCIFYIVKDKQEHRKYDIIHYLPYTNDGTNVLQPETEWSISKRDRKLKTQIKYFLRWRNKHLYQQTIQRKIGKLVFAGLVGIGIGYFFVEGILVNPIYLIIGIPSLIYFIYMFSDLFKFNKKVEKIEKEIKQEIKKR